MNNTGQTVLLVDDDLSVRQYLQNAVEKLGYQVTTAMDGDTFKEAFKECNPDIVLLDLIIPGSDSIEMLKFLAASHCEVPVLLMSGLDGHTIQVAAKLGRAHGLRMFGGLEKPFDHGTLKDLLAKAGREKHHIAEDNLIEAIDRGELRVYYQPQVDASDGHLVGAEVLLRWQHPEYGILLPGYFLPLAQNTDVRRSITRWVCSTALSQLAEWRRLGIDMTISINLFGTDITDESFPDWLEARTTEFRVEPRQIVLEVTERDATTQIDLVREVMTRLRFKGFQLSIDDFGTGYSSFAMLQQIPFGELKIDKCFVMEALTEPGDRAIVEALVGLGTAHGLRVVAEGVEDEPTLNFMRSLGLPVIQGYHTGRPMPAETFMHGFDRSDESKLSA